MRAFSRVETLLFAGSLILVGLVVPAIHRAVWTQAELLSYRATMRDLTRTVQAMRSRAKAQHRLLELRVNAVRGVFELASIEGGPNPLQRLERTIWLPKGLTIGAAPDVLTASPTGELPSASIIVEAPSYNRQFRLTTHETGLVQLHEEPTS